MIVNRFVFAFSLFLMTWAALLWGNSLGPPADRSGVSGVTCSTSGCHNDLPANAGGGSVSIAGLPAEWTPGVPYPLQVSVSHSGASRYGFQMTAVDSNGAQAGGFVIGTGTAIQSGSVGGKTIEHMQHSFASPNNTFSFSWTAPETSSTGAVRFNVAANAANGNFNRSGDFIYFRETSISPVTLTAEGEALAPADPAAFDALVIGQRMLSSLAPASLYHVDFVEAGRFEETRGAATYAGSYSYTNTGPDTGTVVFNYDDGDSCTNSVTFVSPTTGSLTYTCNDGTSGETNWRLVDDPDYVPLTPPETGTGGTESFSIPDRGGTSTTSSGSADTLRVGYGRIRADAGSTTPSGIAIFQFRDSEGVLISEAGVPASEPVQEGRIFAEVNGPVNTGLAIANPNDVPATIQLLFHRHQRHPFRGRQLRTRCAPADGEIPGSGAIQRWTLRIGNLHVYLIGAGRCRRPPWIHQRSRRVPDDDAPGRAPVVNRFGYGLLSPFRRRQRMGDPDHSRKSNGSDDDRYGRVSGTGERYGCGLARDPDAGRWSDGIGLRLLNRSPQRPEIHHLESLWRDIQWLCESDSRGRKRGAFRSRRLFLCPRWKDPFGSGRARAAQRIGISCLCRSFRYARPDGFDKHRTGHRQHGGHIQYGDAGGDTPRWIAGGASGHTTASTVGPGSQFHRRDLRVTAGQLLRSAPGYLDRRCRHCWIATAHQRERGELKMTTTPPSNETGPSTTADVFFPHFADSGGWSTQFILYSGTAGQAVVRNTCVSSTRPGNRWI